MARYINIDNIPDIILDGKVINPKLDLPNNNVTVRDILECTHEEDVVERSEYQKLKEENTELVIITDNFLHLNEVLRKENSRLHEKIDKAIKEIIEYRDDKNNDFDPYEVEVINAVLEIIKKNIKEWKRVK